MVSIASIYCCPKNGSDNPLNQPGVLRLLGVLVLSAALGACGPGGDDKGSGDKSGAPAKSGAPGGAPSKGAGGPGKGPAGPVTARVIQVAPQRVPIVLEAVGQTEGSKQVEVRARVTGIVQKRIYTEGDLVREGAPLFQIDPEPFRITLAQTQAQLAQERARNEQAQREAARLKDLAAQRAISQKEFDDASSGLKLSNATLQVAEANVKQAELNLSYTRVTAPVSGVSGRAVRSEGSLITAGTDSLLTTVNQIQPIWVRFSLSATDLAKVPGARLGRGGATEVELRLADGSSYPIKGKLNFAASQVDVRLGTQELRAEFANPAQRLLPGDFVRVRVIAGYRDRVFLVPQTAVLQNERGHFLFVLDAEGKAAIRPVRAGEWVGADWTILEGLAAGDRIVADNLLRVQPGAVIKPAEPAPSGAVKGDAPEGAAKGGAPEAKGAAPDVKAAASSDAAKK